MAILNNTIINGSLRVNNAAYFNDLVDVTAGTLKLLIVQAPTTSGGSTYSVGSSGQILRSNGTSVFWHSPSTDSAIKAITFGTTAVLTGVKASSTESVIKSITFGTTSVLTGVAANGTANAFTSVKSSPSFSGASMTSTGTCTPNGTVTLSLENATATGRIGVITASVPSLSADNVSTAGVEFVQSISPTKGDYTPTGSVNLGSNSTATNGQQYIYSINTSKVAYVTGISISRSTSGTESAARRTCVISASTNSSQDICTGGTIQYFHPSFSGTKTNTLVTDVGPTSKYMHVAAGATTKYAAASFSGSSTSVSVSGTTTGSVTMTDANFNTTAVLTGVKGNGTAGAYTSDTPTTITAVTGVGANGTANAYTSTNTPTTITVVTEV